MSHCRSFSSWTVTGAVFFSAQCLNAVRTVQSLTCLDEADHTVGFLLQLSSFVKEWQFHLPKLLHDVQVSTAERSSTNRRHQWLTLTLCSFGFWFFFYLFCAGQPVLPLSGLHLSAPQQEDAQSLPPGQTPALTDVLCQQFNLMMCDYLHMNNNLTFFSFRLKTVKLCPLLLFPRLSDLHRLHPRRRRVQEKERRPSRRLCWPFSAACWRSSAKPWPRCSTSPQTAVRFSWTRSDSYLQVDDHIWETSE